MFHQYNPFFADYFSHIMACKVSQWTCRHSSPLKRYCWKMLMWTLQDNLYTGSSYCCIISCKSVVIIQLLSYVWLFATPWTVAGQAPLSSPISLSLLQFTSIDLVMLCNHLTLCCSPLLFPSIFPSIRGFPRSQFFASGSQSTGASTSATVLPRIIQGWFSLWLTG